MRAFEDSADLFCNDESKPAMISNHKYIFFINIAFIEQTRTKLLKVQVLHIDVFTSGGLPVLASVDSLVNEQMAKLNSGYFFSEVYNPQC